MEGGISMAKKLRNLDIRNNVWYFRKIHKKQRIRISLETTVKAEAKRLCEKIKDFYLDHGFYPSGLTALMQNGQKEIPYFGAVAMEWFNRQKTKFKKSTVRDYRNSLNNFILPEFGNTLVNQITAHDIEVFISKLNIKLRRAQNILCPMRNIFKGIVKAQYIERNPFQDVAVKENTIKTIKAKPDPFSKEEMALIIENIHPFYKNLATVLFYSGMRFSEMAGLKWNNIDFKENVIRVEEVLVEEQLGLPKTEDSQRDILMLPMVIDALREQRNSTWGRGNGFVFLNMAQRNLKPTSFNQKILKKTCSKVGIRYRPVKSTRSTYISLMLDAGVDIGWVAKQVGHSSTKMIHEHYYKYMKKEDPSAKFLAYIAPEKNEQWKNDHKTTTPFRVKVE